MRDRVVAVPLVTYGQSVKLETWYIQDNGTIVSLSVR